MDGNVIAKGKLDWNYSLGPSGLFQRFHLPGYTRRHELNALRIHHIRVRAHNPLDRENHTQGNIPRSASRRSHSSIQEELNRIEPA
jgi:hypothetical protein